MISWMDLMEKARKCWIANYERMVDKIHVLIMEPLLRKNSSPCLSKPCFQRLHCPVTVCQVLTNIVQAKPQTSAIITSISIVRIWSLPFVLSKSANRPIYGLSCTLISSIF